MNDSGTSAENLLEDACGPSGCACDDEAGGCDGECDCGSLPADALALLYLDEPAGTLDPAVLAFVLGNDPEYIEALMHLDEEQSQQWAKDALLANRGEPDPLLVEASGGAPADELTDVNLHESRAWAVSAQSKRHALQYLRANPRPAAEYTIDTAMERVQRAAEAASEASADCDSDEPEDCPDHGAAHRAAAAALAAAVAAMRAEVMAAFDAFTAELQR